MGPVICGFNTSNILIIEVRRAQNVPFNANTVQCIKDGAEGRRFVCFGDGWGTQGRGKYLLNV